MYLGSVSLVDDLHRIWKTKNNNKIKTLASQKPPKVPRGLLVRASCPAEVAVPPSSLLVRTVAVVPEGRRQTRSLADVCGRKVSRQLEPHQQIHIKVHKSNITSGDLPLATPQL